MGLQLAEHPRPLPRLIAATVVGTILLGWLLVTATASPFAGLLALSVPVGVRLTIGFLATRQRRRFDEQLPDNLQVISSALRAGHTLGGALAVLPAMLCVGVCAPRYGRRDLRMTRSGTW